LIKAIHNEQQLLELISEGDEIAFGQLFKYYFEHLYGFAVSVTKSSVLAEEILQDVFVTVWQKRAMLTTIEKFDAWLFIITRNQAYKVIRQQLSRPSYIEHLESYFCLSPDSPEQELLYKEFQALLSDAADTLPTQQRLVFIKSRLQGLSLDEIASELSLSKNTVKSHLTKAIHTIRLYLQEHSYSLTVLLLLYLCCA